MISKASSALESKVARTIFGIATVKVVPYWWVNYHSYIGLKNGLRIQFEGLSKLSWQEDRICHHRGQTMMSEVFLATLTVRYCAKSH